VNLLGPQKYRNVATFVFQVLLAIPNSLTQAIRNFAKNLESWMSPAVDHLPNELKVIKVFFSKTICLVKK
jgi:regulatory factor X 1/2/3